MSKMKRLSYLLFGCILKEVRLKRLMEGRKRLFRTEAAYR